MSQYIGCQGCSKSVNRLVEVCPYCGLDPGGDRSDRPDALAPPPAGPAAETVRYRPIGSLALFVQLMFGVFILGSLVLVMTAWSYRNTLLDLVANRPIAMDAAIVAEDSYLAASGLIGGANILLAIAFAVWFWRAYSNLQPLGRPRKRKAGWAIGAWFVPIGNFFLPYGIGAEIWTQSRSRERAERNLEPVISWWALFLIMGLVNQIAFFTTGDIAEDPERLASLVGLDLLGSLVGVAAAIAAIRFVRLSTAGQESMAHRAGLLTA